ncbi:MAG: DNA repair protein RecO, partial [Chloroflexi bacterium]|nr:DNA repair protein RecO [Chloroflexota bacterium]
KIRAVVKGARRAKSRKGGFLQPLTHVRVSIAEGRTLDQVVEAETVASFRAVREDLGLVSTGLYLADLVDAFSADGAVNPSEFRLLAASLSALESAERPEQLAGYFETRMLGVAGFGPEVRQCVHCGEELAAGDHVFSCADGGLVGPECRTRTDGALIYVSMNAIKVLRFFQAADFPHALDLPLTERLTKDLRRVLGAYITYVLEREPRSAEFMHLVSSG